MGTQAKVVAGAVLGIATLVGGALWLVMQDPEAESTTGDEPEHAQVVVDEPTADAAPGRRRASRTGSASVRGVVVRGRQQEIAEGVTVSLSLPGLAGRTVTTGAAGEFRFAELPPGGPYEVSLIVEEFAPVRVPGIALDRREERDVGTLRLDVAVSVVALVQDTRGAPIPGARVGAFVNQSATGVDWSKRMAQIGVVPVAVGEATTAADGRAHFPALAVSNYTFRATAPGYAMGGVRGRSLEAQEESHELTIHLFKGHAVVGNVTQYNHAAVAGAIVMAMDARGAWSPASAPLHARTTTDETGAFRLDGLDVGDTAIWVALPGGIPAQVALIVVPRVATLDVTLRLGGRLSGTVTLEETGATVPGVTVRATSWQGQSTRVAEVVTDGEGRYVIDTLLEGMINQLIVDKPGYVVVRKSGQAWEQVPLNHGDDITHDITLKKAVVLTGVVRGPDGPLAGARLTLHLTRPNQGWTSFNATSEPDGSYRLDTLEAGNALLQIVQKGYFQRDFPEQWWEALQNGSAPKAWSITIPSSGEVAQNFTLETGGVVVGRVESQLGAPIAGARVRIVGSGKGTGETETGEDGAFRLSGLALDVEVSITASRDGYSNSSERVTVTEGTTLEGVVIRLAPAAVVRGVVSVPEGATIGDAFVQLGMYTKPDSAQPWNWQDPDRRWAWVDRTPVGPDGTFELKLAVTSGQFVVRAVCSGLAAVESAPVDVVAGQDEYTVDLAGSLGSTVRGRAVDKVSGEGLAGAHVKFGRAHPMAASQPWYEQNIQRPVFAVTDSEGAFELPALGDGKFRLVISASGYVEGKVNVTVPAKKDVEVKLAPALEIAGFVRFADGSPAEGANIQAQPLSPLSDPQIFGSQQIVSGSDGSFRIPNLSTGKYRVTAMAPWGGGALNIAAVTLDSVDAGMSDLAITVEAGGTISGRVTDALGEPIAAMQVNAQRENAVQDGRPNFWRVAQTDANGNFEIVGLDQDTFTIAAGGQNGYQNVRLPGVALGTQDVAIRMTVGLKISGVLVDERGDSRADETLSARRILEDGEPQTMQSWHTTQTASDGTFSFDALQSGNYGIARQNYGGGGSAEDRALVLKGGARVAAGMTNVRLTLSTGASISGVVQDADGKGVGGLRVNARLNGDQVNSVGSSPDGSFTITGLADDAEYVLEAQGGQYRVSRSAPTRPGATGIRIVVEIGLTTTGRVVDAAGAGVAKQGLSLAHSETNTSSWVACDENGAFVAQGLDEGAYRVRAFVRGTDADGNPLPSGRFVDLGELTAGTDGVEFTLPD